MKYLLMFLFMIVSNSILAQEIEILHSEDFIPDKPFYDTEKYELHGSADGEHIRMSIVKLVPNGAYNPFPVIYLDWKKSKPEYYEVHVYQWVKEMPDQQMLFIQPYIEGKTSKDMLEAGAVVGDKKMIGAPYLVCPIYFPKRIKPKSAKAEKIQTLVELLESCKKAYSKKATKKDKENFTKLFKEALDHNVYWYFR